MENYKELLTALYKEHAPEKLDQVDFYLNKYEGKEKQFYITQKAKYANKKSVKDSKKILEEAMARINKDKEKSNEDKPDKPTPDKEKSKKESPKKEARKESIKVPVVPTVKKEELPIEEKKLETPKEEKEKEALKQDLNPPILKGKAEKKEPKTEKAKEEATIAAHIPINKDKEIEKPKVEIPKKPIDDDARNKQKEKEDKKDKRRFPILWFFFFILFFIIAALLIYFFWYRDLNPSKEQGLTVEKVQVDETNNTVLRDKTETVQEESAVEKEMNQPTADRLYASNLQKPVIFVACFAEKKEELAQKKVALLKEYGLMGHYYWIPDIDPQGNAFFKIVVGPFKTNREAYPSLTKVQERINFDAYILVVK